MNLTLENYIHDGMGWDGKDTRLFFNSHSSSLYVALMTQCSAEPVGTDSEAVFPDLSCS